MLLTYNNNNNNNNNNNDNNNNNNNINMIEHDRLIYRYAICDLSKTSHKVVGERIAGAVEKEITLKDNEAMYVTTGAVLPRGTRAVVPIEQTKKSKDGIEINTTVKLNQWIRFRGSDLSKGDVAIPKGTQIEACLLYTSPSPRDGT